MRKLCLLVQLLFQRSVKVNPAYLGIRPPENLSQLKVKFLLWKCWKRWRGLKIGTLIHIWVQTDPAAEGSAVDRHCPYNPWRCYHSTISCLLFQKYKIQFETNTKAIRWPSGWFSGERALKNLKTISCPLFQKYNIQTETNTKARIPPSGWLSTTQIQIDTNTNTKWYKHKYKLI